MIKKKRVKALVLFSGGLDSILVVEILRRQGIEVTGLTLTSAFFDSRIAREMAKKLHLRLKVLDISQEHWEIVKSPKYGHGKGMNPCLDCRILMLKKARELMAKGKFDFVATGEVLGERPMTQRKTAMKLVEKESGLQGFLLRPLSARLIQITIPVKQGWVQAKKLYAISGRSRKEQMRLAKKFGLEDYPTPSGGCLLTDPEFSKKLQTLLKVYPKATLNDVELLKNGRQFWEEKGRIVVGRDKKENQRLKKIAQAGDLLVELENYPGPLALVRCYHSGRKVSQKLKEKAQQLVQYYSLKARGKKDANFAFQQL